MPEMQLDGIESGVDRDLGGRAELVNHHDDLVSGDLAAVRHGRRVDEPARGHRGDTGEPFVRHHPGVTQLRGDRRARGVHRVGQPLQSRQCCTAHHDLTRSAGRLGGDTAVRHGGHPDAAARVPHVEVDQVVGNQAVR